MKCSFDKVTLEEQEILLLDTAMDNKKDLIHFVELLLSTVYLTGWEDGRYEKGGN